ncbi:MAG: Nif3-like dinuclear metal center hexameric protein [Flavobacteriales bacterium]|nr:Nif3-like dinuclear metal center hexameric protein [Flavobacteriales bacterium]
MKLKEITKYIEEIAPLSLQESYDNAGLIVGNPEMVVKGALICLDSIESVLDEAIELGCNLVIAHHPIVFSGLKKLNGASYVERVVIKAIKNDIAIYAAHTNLDNVRNGVNKKIADRLELKSTSILVPKDRLLNKLITFCPKEKASEVREALFGAGAGNIGEYSECSFSSEGEGTYKASERSNPYAGEQGKRHSENEIKIEVVFPSNLKTRVIQNLVDSHPYEEVAYDIIQLENKWNMVGSGMIGELDNVMDEEDFLKYVSVQMNTKCIRHTSLLNKPIKRVAICGGAGSFLIKNAIAAKADVLITGDVKYHEFFDADNQLVIMDVGHYESEQFTCELFYEILIEKFPTFALHLSKMDTNSINYYYGRN